MTKVKMPAPGVLRTVIPNDYRYGHVYGYTAKQMQAYAGARVKEALESPEIKQAISDSKRIDWLADVENTTGGVVLPNNCVTENLDSLRAAIDAAMKEQEK